MAAKRSKSKIEEVERLDSITNAGLNGGLLAAEAATGEDTRADESETGEENVDAGFRDSGESATDNCAGRHTVNKTPTSCVKIHGCIDPGIDDR